MEIPVERVREIQKVAQEPVSLETPIGEEEDSHLGDFIEGAFCIIHAYTVKSQAFFSNILQNLQISLVKVIFQLAASAGMPWRSRTLEEVGQEFGVTRERIRQIEAKALRKLRHTFFMGVDGIEPPTFCL